MLQNNNNKEQKFSQIRKNKSADLNITHIHIIHVCDRTHLYIIHVCNRAHVHIIHVCDRTHMHIIHVCHREDTADSFRLIHHSDSESLLNLN